MSEYKKGKYSFSLAPALVLVGKEIVEERKNQVEGFIRELEDYNIIISFFFNLFFLLNYL